MVKIFQQSWLIFDTLLVFFFARVNSLMTSASSDECSIPLQWVDNRTQLANFSHVQQTNEKRGRKTATKESEKHEPSEHVSLDFTRLCTKSWTFSFAEDFSSSLFSVFSVQIDSSSNRAVGNSFSTFFPRLFSSLASFNFQFFSSSLTKLQKNFCCSRPSHRCRWLPYLNSMRAALWFLNSDNF